MKTLITQIKNVVPKGIKVTAATVFAIGVICMAVFAFKSGVADAHATRGGAPPASLLSAFSLLAGIFVALWLLAMGYIYADSKHRGMPPALWLAVAILVPNMIGFILYFALRKPLLVACASCGQGVTPGQRFCPSCGHEQGSSSGPSSNPTSSSGIAPLARKSNGMALKSFALGLSGWIGIFLAKSGFAFWKHANLDAAGCLVLASFCAVLAITLPKAVRQ